MTPSLEATNSLLGIVDFEHTIILPILVIGFIEIYKTFIETDPVTTLEYVRDPIMLHRLHTDLTYITDYVIHFTERLLTIDETSRYLSMTESITRYRNVVNLHTQAEEVFEHVQSIIMNLERALALDNANELITNECQQLIIDTDRLRLAGNILVKGLRFLEGSIRDTNPAFEFLSEQWFEN